MRMWMLLGHNWETSACPRSGRLRTRAVGPERTLATVRINTKLRDMNVAISASDAREIEVFASGLPLHHGAQLAVDIIVRSALTVNGSACPKRSTHRRHGAAQFPNGQGKEISRALGRRTMSLGGCGSGSRRAMEHRGVC